MAISSNDAFGAGGGARRRRRSARGRRGTLSEINVTPLVDVMLVLLIVFMISAPLLTVGVPVDLPKTEAGALQDQTEPLSVSIRADGSLFVQEDPVPFSGLAPRLKEMAGDDTKKPIYVRADGKASYSVVAQVMAALSTSGFTSINLITDTGGPTSGDKPAPEQAGAP
jgi:biopolymer transport protein TolR